MSSFHPSRTNMAPAKVLTTTVGKFHFGLDVMRVQEVLQAQAMTSVPLAPPVIRGLINLRGEIVPAIDFRGRLNLNELAPGTLPMNVIIRRETGAVSLLVDEVGEVYELEQKRLARTPDNLSSELQGLIQGVYQFSDSLLLLLDIDQAISVGSLGTQGGP